MRFVCFAALFLFCVATGPALAQPYLWCWNADLVSAQVVDSTITVLHLATVYNCCPDHFEFSVTHDGHSIVVVERAVMGHSICACNCCFNLSVDIEHVAPGTYSIDFTWWDGEQGGWAHWPLEVVVPDVGQKEELTMGAMTNSPCIQTPSSVPEDPGPGRNTMAPVRSWGEIKHLYR
jgi:hypothetical protein